MKFYQNCVLQLLCLVAVSSAAPQGLRDLFDAPVVEEPSARSSPVDIIQYLLSSLAPQRNSIPFAPQRDSPFPPRRENSEGNLLRVLVSLFANELGLSGLDGRSSDSVDQELLIRNLIRIVSNVVGNVLLA